MIKNDTYIVIPSWAVTKLGLKGNSLLIYSLIYGFCQDGESCFHGSLEYIQEWTRSTRQGVINSIKDLVNKGLIIKESGFPNNRYYVNKKLLTNCKSCNCKQILQMNEDSSKKSLHNNIDNISISKDIDIYNSEDKSTTTTLEKNKYIQNKEIQSLIDDVVEYMNSVCHSHFRSSSSGTKKFIKSRIKEGYSFNDFKDVIDFKWKEWGENPVKFSTGQMSDTYIRPSTLFGNKFEEYLQAAWLDESRKNKLNEVVSSEKSKQRSTLKF